MAFHYSPNIVTDGLILYVDGANTKSFVNTTTGWRDLTGKYGTLALTGASYVNEVSGVLRFDGSLGSSASITATIPQTAGMTWDLWFNKTLNNVSGGNPAAESENVVFSYFDPNIGSPLFPYFSFRNSGYFLFQYASTSFGTSTGTPLYSPGTYSNNVWYNVTCTLTRNVTLLTSTSTMYVNGVSVVSLGTVNDTIPAPSALKIANYNSAIYPFNGKISNIKIYNKTLTANEVLQNYNATKTRFGL